MTTAVGSRIVSAIPAGERRIALKFADGSRKVVDVAPLLRGPVFEHIAEDDDAFAALYVDPQLGTVCWPGDIDLAPEALAGLPDVTS